MSKKSNKRSKQTRKPVAKKVTAVRNTSIPKAATRAAKSVARAQITQAMIAIRAYEISQSPACSSETDNWHRAERELRGL